MRSSPYTPSRVKAKGKEISRDVLKPRLSRARGRATRLTREVDAALDEAIAAFNGMPDDRRIWAAIAWRIGAENFHHAVLEKISENNADGWPRKPAAAFQRFLDRRYPKQTGAAGMLGPRRRGLQAASSEADYSHLSDAACRPRLRGGRK